MPVPKKPANPKDHENRRHHPAHPLQRHDRTCYHRKSNRRSHRQRVADAQRQRAH